MIRSTKQCITVKANDGLFHTVVRSSSGKIIDIYTKKEVSVNVSRLKHLA